MKKALLLFAITATAIFVVLAVVVFAMVYVRDAKTIERAQTVVLRVNQFCSEHGRLPEKDEFAALFPDLAASADWFYWPTPNYQEALIQYPMSSHHQGAPGRPKTSAFTATTYAYIVSVKCPR